MESEKNSTEFPGELIETLEALNKRYVNALVPMAFWLGVLSVVGIFGNLLVIAVFAVSPQCKKTKFRVYVIALAIVDLLTCVSLMPAEIFKTRHYFSFPDAFPCKVKCFFNLFGQNASALVLLVICVDRFSMVWNPLKSQIRSFAATKVVVVIMLLSFLLAVPAPILCGISSANKTNIHGTNTTVFFCAAEQKYHSSPFRYCYKIGLSVIFLVMSIAYIVMYSLILRTIFKSLGNRRCGESVRLDSIDLTKKSNKHDVEENPFPEEVKALVRVPDGGSKNCSPSGAEVVSMPVFNEFPASIQNDGKHKCHSTKSNASSKSKNSLRKTRPLRSGSESSSRTCSLHRKSSSVRGSRIPYKTLIWLILTFVFIVTYFTNAVLSFTTTKVYELSPLKLLGFIFFFRIYFINNIINPIIYLWLDQRFKLSCAHLFDLFKRKFSHLCSKH